jgi:membrane-associated protease RseP (regulator of RpoE activity)
MKRWILVFGVVCGLALPAIAGDEAPAGQAAPETPSIEEDSPGEVIIESVKNGGCESIPGMEKTTLHLFQMAPADPEKPVRATVVRAGGGAALGVVVSPVPEALARHLKLADPSGLLVETVMKDSAAAAAGIRKHDVLVKFDDQILVNAEQLHALIRQRKPKEQVQLTLYREGQEQRLKVALGESKKEDASAPLTLRTQFTPLWTFGEGKADEALRSYQGALRLLESQLVDPKTMQYIVKASAASTRTTPDGLTLSLKSVGDTRRLTVKDKNGKVLFEGSVQTEAQRNLLAPEIRKPVDEMIEESKKKEKDEPRSQSPAGAAKPYVIYATRSRGGTEPLSPTTASNDGLFIHPHQSAYFTLSMAGQDGASLVVSWDAEGQCTVKAKDGKVAYEGPIDTEEQRQKIPESIRAKMKKLIDLLSTDQPKSP